jgi:Zn-dependent protease with chaperone function
MGVSDVDMTIGSSIVLIAAGAILRWAVTAHVSGFNIQTAGLVLFLLGIVGLLLAILYTFVWSRRAPTTTTYVPRDERETRTY